MEIVYAIIIAILPLFLSLRTIFLLRKNPKVSDFMKSIIKAILGGIILVSISVSVHHFMNLADAKSNMSVGVLTSVQIIMSGVVFLVSRVLSRLWLFDGSKSSNNEKNVGCLVAWAESKVTRQQSRKITSISLSTPQILYLKKHFYTESHRQN